MTMLDPAPRVVLDKELGVCAVGRSAKDAAIVFDIYEHTMEIIQRAELLGGWKALPAKDIFDVEYWDLEQAKLKGGGKPAVFAGEVALVTGAASGIGKACVESLLKRGAAVVGLDIQPAIETLFKRKDYLGLRCDVTDEFQIQQALERAVCAFGGLDMLVLNAGIFPAGCRIDALSTHRVEQGHAHQPRCQPCVHARGASAAQARAQGRARGYHRLQERPGPGSRRGGVFGFQGALNQLARVAALEWGGDNIRINSLHPNAVFDTGIWTDAVLKARAKHYGLTVEQYKKNNVLKIEVTSRDVAELAAEMCGPLFAKTTAAQVPVDGGNERVI